MLLIFERMWGIHIANVCTRKISHFPFTPWLFFLFLILIVAKYNYMSNYDRIVLETCEVTLNVTLNLFGVLHQ